MTILNYPEDSILKRHFDATVEMKRQLWLQMPPTDSILRRHAMSLSSHATTRSSAAAAKPASPRPHKTSAAPSRPMAREEKGFFAKLFALFSGKP